MAEQTKLESILWYHDVILYFLSNKFLLNQHLMLFTMKDFLDIKAVLWKILWSFSGIYRAVNECTRTSGYTNVHWCKKTLMWNFQGWNHKHMKKFPLTVYKLTKGFSVMWNGLVLWCMCKTRSPPQWRLPCLGDDHQSITHNHSQLYEFHKHSKWYEEDCLHALFKMAWNVSLEWLKGFCSL